MTARLFTPFAIGGVTLANRIAVSPMCQYSAREGVPTAWHRVHLGTLALSGAGLVIVEATGVEQIGRITPGCTGLWNDSQEMAFTGIVRDMKAIAPSGLKVGIQLAHAGRKASSARPWEGDRGLKADEGAWQPVAPSADPFGANRPVPAALDEAGLARIRVAFAESARRADRAGFDLVELHAAHGYLLHSFVTPLANQRTDQYGGSRENRMRFPLEVAAAVRAVWPRSKALGMRISGTDWVEGAWDVDDAVELTRLLGRSGLDYVCVSSGGARPGIRIPVEPGYQVPFARHVRERTGLTTMAVGMIVTPPQAEAIITEGNADLVAIARGFLDDPRWAWHAADRLGADLPVAVQLERARPRLWPGAAFKRAAE